MNQTEFPSLAVNDAVAGFVFQQQDAADVVKVDRKKLEKSYVDLISKLENLYAKAKGESLVDFVDESATVARKMLEALQEFCNEFLTGQAANQAREEIGRAKALTHTYDEVLKTRSLVNSFLRAFWKVDESEQIRLSHEQLGEGLVRSCAATLYHSIMLVGCNTDSGKEMDQSAVVFVNELKQSWQVKND